MLTPRNRDSILEEEIHTNRSVILSWGRFGLLFGYTWRGPGAVLLSLLGYEDAPGIWWTEVRDAAKILWCSGLSSLPPSPHPTWQRFNCLEMLISAPNEKPCATSDMTPSVLPLLPLRDGGLPAWLAWTNRRQWKWCLRYWAEAPEGLLASACAPWDHLPGYLGMLPWDRHGWKKPKMKDQIERLSWLHPGGHQKSPSHPTATAQHGEKG